MPNPLPAGLKASDYDAIEAAVMETARGRWFLIEYDRRRRAEENNQLLEAVSRLEKAIGTDQQPALPSPAKPAAIAGPATAPSDVSQIGERLQDIAWSMRERGFDDAICGEIETQARLLIGMPASPADAAPRHRAEPRDPRLDALARIDAMPLAEKLALFV